MNKSDKKYIGKGATTHSSSLNKVFKPLIASSLALALGVSVASGAVAAPTTCTNSNGTIGVCINGNTDIYSSVGFIWNGVNGTSIYQPALQSGKTPINKLTFNFNGSNTAYTGDQNDFIVSVASTSTSLTISGAGKTLQMNDGLGILKFDLGSTAGKSATLALNALNGNLELAGSQSTNTFTGTFAGNDAKISGRVILSGTTANNINSGNDAFVIEKGIYVGSVGGQLSFNGTNITIKNGTSSPANTGTAVSDGGYAIANANGGNYSATFNFSGASANINIGNVISRYNGGGLTFNVKGANSTLNFTGLTDHDKAAGIVINFEQANGTLTPNIQAGDENGHGKITINFKETGTNTIKGDLYSKFGTNLVTFENANAKNTITGNVRADYLGNNTVKFNNTAANPQSISGSVIANAGKNNITFKSNASIAGSITTNKGGGFSSAASNTIIFEKGGTIGTENGNNEISVEKAGSNTITFQGSENATIYGGVKTIYNSYSSVSTTTKNEITFEGSAVNKIVGGVSATSGGGDGNIIKFTAGTDNSITGTITAGEGQASGKNTITFAGANNTISASSQNGDSLRAMNGENTLTFSGATKNIISNRVFAQGGTNIITFDDKTLGKNSIQKGVVANAGGTNTIEFQGATGTHEILGNVTATAGNNSITFAGTGLIAGSVITNQGGWVETTSSTIAFGNGGTIGVKNGNNEISVEKTGSNTIIFDGAADATIYANIKTKYNSYTGFITDTKNDITFNGSATNKIDGSLSASSGGGAGNIVNFTHVSSTNIITGGLTAGEGGASGKNTISFEGASNQIGGSIIANSGENAITVVSGGLTIGGSVIATSVTEASNTIAITAGGATFSKGIASYVYTGNSHKNSITVDAGTTTVNSSNFEGADYAIYANNKNNANEITANILKVTGDIYAGVQSSNTVIAKNAGENVIVGNITTSGGSSLNLAINGLATDTKSSYLSGNITNNGNMNIILQDAIWNPTVFVNTQPFSTSINSGILTNTGGNVNLIIRTTNAVVNQNDIPIYGVNANAGHTNIVMQGDASAIANLNYGGGNATLIFASSSTGTDSFDESSNNLSQNKLLGKTYENGVKLALHDYSVAIQDTSKSLINTFGDKFRNANGALLILDVKRTTNEDTIKIDGLVSGDISSLASSQTSKKYNVHLAERSAFVGSLGIQSTNISLTMDKNTKLVFAGDKNVAYSKISTLNVSGAKFDSQQTMNPIFDQTNTVINLATGVNDVNNAPSRDYFRLLVIGEKNTIATGKGFVTDATNATDGVLFQVYVNNHANGATLGGKTKEEWATANASQGNYGEKYMADRIVIHNAGDNTTASTQHLQVVYDAKTEIDTIKYSSGGTEVEGNVAVATVANTTSGSQGGVVKFNLQNTLQGFDEIVSTLKDVTTDEFGKENAGGGYTTYFVSNAKSAGASEANREATATAFGLNYDLYMANFNSLNKRMGELRDNPHSQGAWIRIFNGSQTNDMGLGTKSSYTTFQGGYDYAFGFEGANNYVGLAIAYGMSDSKTQSSMSDLNGSQRGVENIKSNAVEVALYNAYVQDEGWYNDTIAKFSYIFSDFNMMGQNSTYSTSNMAFTLSDEFGYRFKLGENKEWTIDPQLEMAFGYFDQSDFVQKLGVATLDSTLDSISTLRTRVGSSFGYNFKNFTENKPVKASLYLGAFYEFDYISGGDITMTTNLGSTNSINSLSSDGRVVVNAGTNIEVYNNTRIYFDFESSFAGKIRTDYQVNIGARYSFGENTGYTPAVAKAKEVAPLKIEEVKPTEQSTQAQPTQEQNTQEKK